MQLIPSQFDSQTIWHVSFSGPVIKQMQDTCCKIKKKQTNFFHPSIDNGIFRYATHKFCKKWMTAVVYWAGLWGLCLSTNHNFKGSVAILLSQTFMYICCTKRMNRQRRMRQKSKWTLYPMGSHSVAHITQPFGYRQKLRTQRKSLFVWPSQINLKFITKPPCTPPWRGALILAFPVTFIIAYFFPIKEWKS